MLINFINYLKAYEILLFIIAILLPFTEYFSAQFTSIVIILLFVAWLVFNDKKEAIRRLQGEKIILLLIAVYFININGLFREGTEGITEKILLKKLSLVILPVIIATSPQLSFAQIKKIILLFTASLLTSTLFTYANGIDYLLKLQDDLTDLTRILAIHRPYFGLFCAFSILSLGLFSFDQQKLLLKIIMYVLIAYFTIFISIIYAKMALLALIVSFALIVLIWLLFKKAYAYVLVLSLLILLSLVTVYNFKPSVKNHVSTILSGKDFSFAEYNVVLVGSINTRYVNWGCAMQILTTDKNWLFGVGPGNAQKKLQECYKIRNEWVYNSKMNAHNQYIEETLHNGIGGLLLFLSSLIIPAIIAFKRKDLLYLAFLIVFSLCCITESILTRQIGIIFYAFFNSLFLFNSKRQVLTLGYV